MKRTQTYLPPQAETLRAEASRPVASSTVLPAMLLDFKFSGLNAVEEDWTV